jgi:hypothetical protein
MRDLKNIIEVLNNSIERYETCQLGLVADQSEILRDLSTSLHWLEEHRVKAYADWMSYYFNSKGKTNAEKEREAEKMCPELYMIRHFISSGRLVFDSVRSTLSANKG